MTNIKKKDYGMRMKELREKRKLTQKQACKLLGVSESSLSTYERNVREPDILTLVRMADLYNTTLDYIVYKENETVISLKGYSKSQQQTLETILNALDNEFKQKK